MRKIARNLYGKITHLYIYYATILNVKNALNKYFKGKNGLQLTVIHVESKKISKLKIS